MSKNKFSTGIILGAIIGGAVSLLDRETRRQTFDTAKKSGQAISYYSTNPRELSDKIQAKVEQLKGTVDQIQDDYEFLSSKYNEVKDMTPQLQNILTETKETFESSGENYKQVFSEDQDGKGENENLFNQRNHPEGQS
ncbi:YtxH domain-containing protein [Jeotgalibacillus marinus]|uniref:YtxH domain-containing protein n=1 Tax=Jeotgalibacillus marinus TaxID=86667 RepID=A0ABV3Q067_9BACL